MTLSSRHDRNGEVSMQESSGPLNEAASSRSIDDFLEAAYRHQGELSSSSMPLTQRWQYYVIFLALGIANSGDSAEMSCTNYILSSPRFQQDMLSSGSAGEGEDGDIDFAGRGASVASAHFAGMLISGLLAGVLADVWGRRSTLLLGLISNSVVGVASALVRSAVELALLRFLCGLGLGMVVAGVVTLSAEISPPSRRGRYMTLVGSCYTLGFLFTSLWAFLIFRVSGSGSWRLFMFINVLPTILAALLVLAQVPESPRFFLCRGKVKEAVAASNRVATMMGYQGHLLDEDELTSYLLKAKRLGRSSTLGRDALEPHEQMRNTAEDNYFLAEVWAGLSNIGQVYSNRMYKVTVPIQLAYFAITLTVGVAVWWTKIFQSLELQTDAYALSFYHTLSQIPGMILASGLIDSVGRRQLVLAGFGGASASLMLLSLISKIIFLHDSQKVGKEYSITVLGLACVYTISLCAGYLSLDCLSAESFPTKVRSTGRGVCVATGRFAGFIVQFVYGFLINQNKIPHMLAIAGVAAIFGIFFSLRTTDTTEIDLQDHWDFATKECTKNDSDAHEQSRRLSPSSATQTKYFSIE